MTALAALLWLAVALAWRVALDGAVQARADRWWQEGVR